MQSLGIPASGRLLQELLWPHILIDAILLFLCYKLSSQLYKEKIVEGAPHLPNDQVAVCRTHILCGKRYEPWFTFSIPRQSIVRRKHDYEDETVVCIDFSKAGS